MKKPYHWNLEADENRAILSAVGLICIREVVCLLSYKISPDEMDSALWGIWIERHKELRRNVYSFQRLAGLIIKKIMKDVQKRRTSVKDGKHD